MGLRDFPYTHRNIYGAHPMNRDLMRRYFVDCRGATAVEMAIVSSTVLFLLIFGIIGTGMLMQAQLSLNYAVETAARCAAIMGGATNSPCPTSNYTTVESYAANQFVNLSTKSGTPTFTASAPANGCGGTTQNPGPTGQQVSATYAFKSLLYPYVPYKLTLSASACFPG